MNTEKELNFRILSMTMLIAEKAPELSKYIAEMSIQDISDPVSEISLESLKDYYNSLSDLFKKYIRAHRNPAPPDHAI